ncbi:MAG: hypothetical protein ACOC4G_12765, partial [Bacillota bacterium]
MKKFKNYNLLLILGIIAGLFLTSTVIAQEEEEFIDPDIPESWYEAPETASELEIEKFDQSPMLDEKV